MAMELLPPVNFTLLGFGGAVAGNLGLAFAADDHSPFPAALTALVCTQ